MCLLTIEGWGSKMSGLYKSWSYMHTCMCNIILNRMEDNEQIVAELQAEIQRQKSVCSQSYTCTHMHTYTHTHAHARMHTHTHTHKHTER